MQDDINADDDAEQHGDDTRQLQAVVERREGIVVLCRDWSELRGSEGEGRTQEVDE